MPSARQAYIDICALEPVRARFAAGDAVVIVTPSLDEVIWANGAGAALFGFADVGAIVGETPQIGPAAKRQITATSGYPRIGKDRTITVRLASGLMSRAVAFSASEIALPDGSDAILLSAPAPQASWRTPVDTAARAIAGLAAEGQYAAIVDAGGKIAAASADFATLGVSAETLAALVNDVHGERLAKRPIAAAAGLLPAGFLRLTDDPAIHLLVVVDEVLAGEAGEPRSDTQSAAADIDAAAAATDRDMPAAAEAGPGDMEAAPAAGDISADPAANETTSRESSEVVDAVSASGMGERSDGAAAQAESAVGQESVGQAAVTDAPGQEEAAAEVDIAAPLVRRAEEGQTEPSPDASSPLAVADAAPGGDRSVEFVADNDGAAEPAPPPIKVDRSAQPVRFVWKTDSDGRFSEIGREFVATVGEPAADVIGSNFREVAARLGIDPSGEIAGLLERHDTWSGRAVSWPVAGTDLRIPVDLAALPTYDRYRKFAGFRGFGIARAADAVVDPDATGLALVEAAAGDEIAAVDAQAGEQAQAPDANAAATGPDPFHGEPPILTIVPKPDRRLSDKVIRLAEHRQPTIDKNLSPGERNAFREIGDRLKKEAGVPAAPAEPVLRADNDPTGRAERATVAPAANRHGEDESEEPRPAAGPSDDAEHGPPAAVGGDVGDAPVAALDQQTAAVGDVEVEGGSRHEQAPTYTATPPVEAADEPELAADTSEPRLEATEASHSDSGPSDGPVALDAADAAVGSEPQLAAADGAEPAAETPVESVPEMVAEAESLPRPDYMPSAFALGPDRRARTLVDTSILEKLPIPVLIHAGDTLHYANREFLDLTGYGDLAEFDEAGGLGALFGDPYPVEDSEEPEAGRKLRLRTSEGLEYPVEAFLQSVPWGEGKALLLSLRRSWRHSASYPAAAAAPVAPQAAPDLEARIAEMRAIVDTATDGVVLIASDGTIRSISSPAEALFGFDSADVAGKPFTSLFAIESQRAARDYLNGLSENGVASVLNDGREVIGREAQGRFIPLFMTIGKLPNDSGFCAVMRDITQWKRAEEELTQARAQAERASSQKTDFLARVSHEIRTPLNAIIGFSELMLDEKFGPVGNDRYRDYLRDINRSGNHVLDLVNDLLDISKIEAGQQEMSYEAVSLNDTLAETVAMMQPAANRERVIIRSSFAARLPEVVADLRSVRQIALNLLSNAVRYTPAGGQVIVSTAYEASGDVVMRVRDTGIGMTQAEIEQALKPFKQINALKRARGDGTGLGLPLTKAMVEANRARFIINSTPGEGTLVEVSFPSTRVLAD
jgi:PAS domain S-box-containing protein